MPKLTERVKGTYTGFVESGLGIAATMMASDDFSKRIAEITSLKIVPGTLNVKVDHEPDKIDAQYFAETHPDLLKRHRKGMWLWRVLIAGLYEGFVFQGDEPDYPNNLVEIVSDHQLRRELNLSDGDEMSFMILPFIASV